MQPPKDHTQERIKGVFSTQLVSKIGTGATTRRTVQQTYYYAEEDEHGAITLQSLSTEHLPEGEKQPITREELLATYAPEPEFYLRTVFPKLQELNKLVARGDRHRKRGETFTAELEYSKALKIDEQNVRANFGIGLCYMQRGDTDKAEDIFQRLVKLDATFEEEHKHLFNEFGISLRKSKMCDQAVIYYTRALEMSPQDENLRYNKARAHFELQEYPTAASEARAALEINPEFAEARKMLDFMVKKGLISG